jgi:hypothetical protein
LLCDIGLAPVCHAAFSEAGLHGSPVSFGSDRREKLDQCRYGVARAVLADGASHNLNNSLENLLAKNLAIGAMH